MHCSWDAENFNLVSQILFFSLIEHNYFIISSFHSSTLFFITFKSLNVKREKRKLLEKREQREEFDRPHFNHIKSWSWCQWIRLRDIMSLIEVILPFKHAKNKRSKPIKFFYLIWLFFIFKLNRGCFGLEFNSLRF